jgi:hypothetical protein
MLSKRNICYCQFDRLIISQQNLHRTVHRYGARDSGLRCEELWALIAENRIISSKLEGTKWRHCYESESIQDRSPAHTKREPFATMLR